MFLLRRAYLKVTWGRIQDLERGGGVRINVKYYNVAYLCARMRRFSLFMKFGSLPKGGGGGGVLTPKAPPPLDPPISYRNDSTNPVIIPDSYFINTGSTSLQWMRSNYVRLI